MYKTFLSTLLVASLSGLPLLHAGPVSPQQIPADAAFVAHLNFEAARGTALGKYLLGQMDRDTQAVNQLAAFAAMFRFDPVKDLRGITLSGADPERAAVLIDGQLDTEHLLTLVKANDGYRDEQVDGVRLLSWIDEHKDTRTYGGISPKGQVILGESRLAVLAQLATLDRPGFSLADANKYGLQLPGGRDALLSMVVDLKAMGEVAPEARMLKSARLMTLTLAEAGDLMRVRIRMDAADAQMAQDMHGVMTGLLSLARLNREENPEMARLAQAARLMQDGASVRLELVMPSDELIDMVEASQLD